MIRRKKTGRLVVKMVFQPGPDCDDRIRRVVEILRSSYDRVESKVGKEDRRKGKRDSSQE